MVNIAILTDQWPIFVKHKLDHSCTITRYSFTVKQVPDCEVPLQRTHHRNNDVPALRGETYNISLKILHQMGIELARQATAIAKRYALTIVLMRYLTLCRIYDLLGCTHALPHSKCELYDLLGGTHVLPHSM